MSKMRQFYSGTRTANLDSSSQLRQTASQAIQLYRSTGQGTHLVMMICHQPSVSTALLETARQTSKADPIIHTHNPKGLSATSDKQREPFLQN
jgi:hypothetical protein